MGFLWTQTTHQDLRCAGFFVVLSDPLLSGFLFETKKNQQKPSLYSNVFSLLTFTLVLVYDLYCSQPPGGTQDILASFLGAVNVVHLYSQSNNFLSNFDSGLNMKRRVLIGFVFKELRVLSDMRTSSFVYIYLFFFYCLILSLLPVIGPKVQTLQQSVFTLEPNQVQFDPDPEPPLWSEEPFHGSEALKLTRQMFITSRSDPEDIVLISWTLQPERL